MDKSILATKNAKFKHQSRKIAQNIHIKEGGVLNTAFYLIAPLPG
jgi:hypothetical protein